jgi:hypothetical protein
MRSWMVLGCLALAACGSDEQSTTVAGTTYTSSDKDERATISNARGSISTVSGASAANTKLPDFAPRYPGSNIESVIDSKRDGRASTMVTLTTADPVQKVVDFYRPRFEGAGLAKKSEMITEEAGMLAAEAADKKASIAVSREEGKTSIVLSYTLR